MAELLTQVVVMIYCCGGTGTAPDSTPGAGAGTAAGAGAGAAGGVKRSVQKWTAREKHQFLEHFSKHGKNWPLLASLIPNKTEPQIRNYYQVCVRVVCMCVCVCVKFSLQCRYLPCASQYAS